MVINPNSEIIDHHVLSQFEESLYEINGERNPYSYTDNIIKALDLAAKDAKSAKGRMSEDVVSTGLSIIVSLLDSLPEALSSRLEFKLPKGLCDLCVLCGENERPALDAAVKRLLKLKFPEAYKLCC